MCWCSWRKVKERKMLKHQSLWVVFNRIACVHIVCLLYVCTASVKRLTRLQLCSAKASSSGEPIHNAKGIERNLGLYLVVWQRFLNPGKTTRVWSARGWPRGYWTSTNKHQYLIWNTNISSGGGFGAQASALWFLSYSLLFLHFSLWYYLYLKL